MNLLTELDAFYTEHRRCSELDGGDRAPLDAHGRQGGVDAHESGRPETEREMIWPAHEKLAVPRSEPG